MKSTVEKLSPTRVKLSIDVEFSELKPHIEGAYKTLSEKINIPGFRKGKVPAAMIDQRVGRGAVLDEAINAALPTFYSQAAKENDVLVIGRPNVDITELKDNEKDARLNANQVHSFSSKSFRVYLLKKGSLIYMCMVSLYERCELGGYFLDDLPQLPTYQQP